MTQYARPDEDKSVGFWGTAPLWSKINEESASDADNISAQVVTFSRSCDVGLPNISDPVSSANHTITVRAKMTRDGTKNATLTVILYQGTTSVASFNTGNLTTGYTNYSYTLSGAEADSITDYSNMKIRFQGNPVAGGSSTTLITFVSWAQFALPDAPAPTFVAAWACNSNAVLKVV